MLTLTKWKAWHGNETNNYPPGISSNTRLEVEVQCGKRFTDEAWHFSWIRIESAVFGSYNIVKYRLVD